MRQSIGMVGTWLLLASLAQADVAFNGLYHNNTNFNAQTEPVPGLVPARFFLEPTYSASNVVVHFLTESPASGLSGDSVSNRVRFFSNVEDFEPATLVTSLVIDAGSPFHGTPTVGAVTVDLYRAVWEPTHGFSGTVYYAPQVRTFSGGNQSDQQYLIKFLTAAGPQWGSNVLYWATNAQAIGDSPVGADYSFDWTNSAPLDFDGFYFNSTNGFAPQTEAVPGLGGPTFLQWNYATNQPSYAYVLAPAGELLSLSTRLFFGSGPGEMIRGGSFFTNVVIDSGAPFHGQPAAGAVTAEVWRTEFSPPSGWSGTVSFAHQITTRKDAATWLVARDGSPNSFSPPQLFNAAGYFGRDWSFTPTAQIVRTSLDREVAYHNNAALDPQAELIPTLSATNFLEVNYARTSTTFYVMTRHFANLVPGEAVTVQMRISWSTNNADNFTTEFPSMTFDRNLVIDSGAPFHGLPASGSMTADLWRLEWTQPNNGGLPYTNAIQVYYAPLIKTLAGADNFQTDYSYLLKVGGPGAGTNGYPVQPQVYGPDAANSDYVYTNQFVANLDSDGDGLTDAEEALYGTLVNDADSDDDGQSDGDEVVAGTNPLLDTSYFKLQAIVLTQGVVRLDWPARTNRLYNVERALGSYSNDIPFTIFHTGLTVAVDGVLSTNLLTPEAGAVYRIRVNKP